MYERTIKALESKAAKALPWLSGAGTTLGELSRDAALRNTDLWDVFKETARQYNATIIPRGLGYVAEGVAIGVGVWFLIDFAKGYFNDRKNLK
jgi:hypothetical protein